MVPDETPSGAVTKIACFFRMWILRRRYLKRKETELVKCGLLPPANPLAVIQEADRILRERSERALAVESEWTQRRLAASSNISVEEESNLRKKFCVESKCAIFDFKSVHGRLPLSVEEAIGLIPLQTVPVAEPSKSTKASKTAAPKKLQAPPAKSSSAPKLAEPSLDLPKAHPSPLITLKERLGKFDMNRDADIMLPSEIDEIRANIKKRMLAELNQELERIRLSESGGGVTGIAQPGGAAVVEEQYEEQDLIDLIKLGICREVQGATVDDLVGDIRSWHTNNSPTTIASLRSTIAEELIVPLKFGLDEVCPLTRFKRRVVLYGPPGNGKSLIARVIVSESGSTFIDLSSSRLRALGNIDPVEFFKQLDRVIRANSPVVIYMESMEDVLFAPAMTKGKGSGKKGDIGPAKFKDGILGLFESISSMHAVLIICINQPNEVWQPLMGKFDIALFIPTLCETDMIYFVKSVLESQGMPVAVINRSAALIQIIAKMADRICTIEVDRAIRKVVTSDRIESLMFHALTPSEFIDAFLNARRLTDTEQLQWETFDKLAHGQHVPTTEKPDSKANVTERPASKPKA